jgi:hypothetical protein
MGARLRAAEARELNLERRLESMKDRVVELTDQRDRACEDAITNRNLYNEQARARLAMEGRLLAAEKKLAAIDAVQHPARDPFELRIQWESRGPHSRNFQGTVIARPTGERITVAGTIRADVAAELRRRVESAESRAGEMRNRPVKPVNDPETGELLGHLIMINGRWRILNEDDLGHAASLESYKAKLRVKVEVEPVTDFFLAELKRATNQVAKAHEERIEDSLMALGWQPPMFSSAAERRKRLLELSKREASRQVLADAIGFRYGCLVTPAFDRSIVKVTTA